MRAPQENEAAAHSECSPGRDEKEKAPCTLVCQVRVEALRAPRRAGCDTGRPGLSKVPAGPERVEVPPTDHKHQRVSLSLGHSGAEGPRGSHGLMSACLLGPHRSPEWGRCVSGWAAVPTEPGRAQYTSSSIWERGPAIGGTSDEVHGARLPSGAHPTACPPAGGGHGTTLGQGQSSRHVCHLLSRQLKIVRTQPRGKGTETPSRPLSRGHTATDTRKDAPHHPSDANQTSEHPPTGGPEPRTRRQVPVQARADGPLTRRRGRTGQTSPGGRQGTAITTKEGLSPGLVQKETKAKGAGQGPGPELDGKSPVGLGQALQEALNHPECSGL